MDEFHDIKGQVVHDLSVPKAAENLGRSTWRGGAHSDGARVGSVEGACAFSEADGVRGRDASAIIMLYRRSDDEAPRAGCGSSGFD